MCSINPARRGSVVSTFPNRRLLVHAYWCLCFMYLRCFFIAEASPSALSSAVELRQAIVAMMNRKDELEEQNTYVGISPCLSAAGELSNAHMPARTHAHTQPGRSYRIIFQYKLCQLVFFSSSEERQFCADFRQTTVQWCFCFFCNKPPQTVIYTHITAAKMDR